jgi:uncharacterized membrane protein YphA (DoxX/SURF4 family)
VALSEEERKRLEILEQELSYTDPDLDRTLQTGGGRLPREAAAVVRGILTLVAGFALVIVGIATELIIIGAVGFLLMLAGAHWFNKRFGLYPGPEATRQET